MCQVMMHFLLSAHLLTLDNRFELIRWPQRAIGLMHFKGGDYTCALEQWTRILDENDPFHLVVCCFYLGLIYSKLKEYKQSVEYFKRALMHTASVPPIFEAQCQMQLGHAIELQDLGCWPSARVHYEKALNFYQNRLELLDEPALALCYAVIGNCHLFESPFTGDAINTI
jgi:tetratricopeptide (TPR) repeat protein